MPNSERENNVNDLYLFIYGSQSYFTLFHFVSGKRKLTFIADQQFDKVKFHTREFTCGISHNANI